MAFIAPLIPCYLFMAGAWYGKKNADGIVWTMMFALAPITILCYIGSRVERLTHKIIIKGESND